MRGVAVLLLATLASACSADPAAHPPDAGPPCLCEGEGMDVQVDFDTTDEQCPVTSLQVSLAFVSGGVATNADVRCRDLSPLSQGARFVLPWPAGTIAGEDGALQVLMTGEGGAFARGLVRVEAAPGTCVVVPIHAECNPIDAGVSVDAAPGLAAR